MLKTDHPPIMRQESLVHTQNLNEDVKVHLIRSYSYFLGWCHTSKPSMVRGEMEPLVLIVCMHLNMHVGTNLLHPAVRRNKITYHQ